MQTRTTVLIFLLLLLPAQLRASDVTPDHPVGWRGNWLGRFPDCTPPLTWERRCTSPVSDIRYSMRKPEGDSDAGAIKPASQSIVHWMVLGPLAPKNPAAALDEETITGEATASPEDGKTWSPFEQESIEELCAQGKSTDDVTEAVQYEKVFPKEAVAALPPGQGVAYAHTYLYSPRAGTVAFLLSHANGMKIWVNGKVAYAQSQPMISNCVNHYDFANFGWHWGAIQTVNLKLERGWNHVLLKSVRGDKGWFFNVRLTAPADATYESKNIAWETHLPSRGHSCPIVVGDRIFLTAEVDELLCIDKKDGKILWRRSNSFYDAATPEERAANPLWKSLDALNAKLQTTTSYPENLYLHKQMQDVLLQIDKAKYYWGDPRFGPTQGNATPTACSDGKQVYVYFSSGVAACYDLDGNRKWIRNNRDLGNVGGYNTQSPAIVDGVFVLYRWRVRGLDANTGAIRWTSNHSPEDERAQCVVPFTLGGEKCVMAHHNHYFRARDGQLLGGGSYVHHSTSVLTENNTVINCMDSNFGQWRLVGMDGNAVKAQGLPGASSPFDGTYNVASPLYHDGRVYVLNTNGNLIVWEFNDAAAKLAYSLKHVPDFHPLVQAWNWNVGLCASPVLGGKYIYIMDNQGTTLALKPGHTFQPLAVNRIENYLPRGWVTNSQENTYSTPVCDGNSMYLRGDETLYCIRGISAVLDADTLTGEAPLTVNADGRNSFSGNGKITAYTWDFGDTATAATPSASHNYTAPGTYTMKLTVKDEAGGSSSVEQKIVVLPPDTVAPRVASVVAGYGKKVVVTFSKPMAKANLENLSNYSITPDVKITAAQADDSGQSVTLTTSLLAEKTPYSIAITNCVDRAKHPNALPETKIPFQTTALVSHWKLDEGKGVTVGDSSGFAIMLKSKTAPSRCGRRAETLIMEPCSALTARKTTRL